MAISDWGIGIVGLGGISLTHLEAYKRRGFNVIAGADPNDRNFETIRTRFGLTQLFEDAANVMALDEVRILDVTVPHSAVHSEADCRSWSPSREGTLYSKAVGVLLPGGQRAGGDR